MYELLALTIVALAALAALYFQGVSFAKERKSLLDRVMAKDYAQYEYYQKMFKEEVDEMKRLRDEARDDRKVEDEFEKESDKEFTEEKAFIASTDEDWKDEEVDLPKLREILKKE